jgi:hypothetical protein
MTSVDLHTAREFLREHLSTGKKNKPNRNKINGLRAERDFFRYLTDSGLGDSTTAGGWLFRTDAKKSGHFGSDNIALIPETLIIGEEYSSVHTSHPSEAVVQACTRLHMLEIAAYYCVPLVYGADRKIKWMGKRLGTTRGADKFIDLQEIGELHSFAPRERKAPKPSAYYKDHNTELQNIEYLGYDNLSEVFTHEHLFRSFRELFTSEASDFDCIFAGRSKSYPVEIKEKTVGNDSLKNGTPGLMGEYFGLDMSPFIKLAFFANKAQNMDSLFVVREIDSVETRNLVAWWAITFEEITRGVSLTPMGGGTSMTGGGSTVAKIPKSAFHRMTPEYLESL